MCLVALLVVVVCLVVVVVVPGCLRAWLLWLSWPGRGCGRGLVVVGCLVVVAALGCLCIHLCSPTLSVYPLV